MFLFGKFPIPFLIKIDFDKRTVIERQVLTNKTDAIKVAQKSINWTIFSIRAVGIDLRFLTQPVTVCTAK